MKQGNKQAPRLISVSAPRELSVYKLKRTKRVMGVLKQSNKFIRSQEAMQLIDMS